MLYSVTVALDRRTVAELVMGESAIHSLIIRSAASDLQSVTIDLDRPAVLELAMLLHMGQEATHREAVLSAQTDYTLQDASGVIKALQLQTKLPF